MRVNVGTLFSFVMNLLFLCKLCFLSFEVEAGSEAEVGEKEGERGEAAGMKGVAKKGRGKKKGERGMEVEVGEEEGEKRYSMFERFVICDQLAIVDQILFYFSRSGERGGMVVRCN